MKTHAFPISAGCRLRDLSAALVLVLFSSCAGAPQPVPTVPPAAAPAGAKPVSIEEAPGPADETDEIGSAAASRAVGFIGLTGSTIPVNGRVYAMDCTGVVLASYAGAGVYLDRDFGRYSGNGVERLYRTMLDSGLVYEPEIPLVGDIVFWDNTYDRNGDGVWNDLYTHVGIVVETDRNGRVAYVHHNYAAGIVKEFMNLIDENTHTGTIEGKAVAFNSPMRMKSHRYLRPDKWLSSHLYKSAAKAYRFQ